MNLDTNGQFIKGQFKKDTNAQFITNAMGMLVTMPAKSTFHSKRNCQTYSFLYQERCFELFLRQLVIFCTLELSHLPFRQTTDRYLNQN